MNKEALIEYKKFLESLSVEDKKQRDKYLYQLAKGEVLGPPTGYSSIDKPWLKYYTEENIGLDARKTTAYNYFVEKNSDNLDATAITFFNKKITYRELLQKIDEVTKSLINLGIKKGDVVTMVMANVPENVYLFYAINRLGAVSNIIDPRLKSCEIEEIISDTKSKFLFALDINLNNTDIEKILANTSIEKTVLLSPVESMGKIIKTITSLNKKLKYNDAILQWQTFISKGDNMLIETPEFAENLPAIMVRTGGTNGKPKTVVLSNENLNEMAFQHEIGEYNFQKGDTFLNFLPPFIAYGICAATHMPLSLGLNNILIPKFDVKDFPPLIKKYKPNVVFGGPILYEKMMEDKKTKDLDLSFFKVPVSGGDTMLPETENKINDYFNKNGCTNKVGQGYGMTEVASSCCYSKANAITSGSVGIPLINNVIAIFDPETQEEKQYGEEGEICIRTNTMMLGYLNNQEATNGLIRTHEDGSIWVHTDDIGIINQNGNLFYKGRRKRMIVSNGSKIFPTDIESVISKNKNVLANAVVEMDHDLYRKVPVAHIVLTDSNVDLETVVNEIVSEIKQCLPDFYVPSLFVIRDELPLTSINKVNFKKLEEEDYPFNNLIIKKEPTKTLKKTIGLL